MPHYKLLSSIPCLSCLGFGRTDNSGDYPGSISFSQHSRLGNMMCSPVWTQSPKLLKITVLGAANRESTEEGGAFLNRHNKNKQAAR